MSAVTPAPVLNGQKTDGKPPTKSARRAIWAGGIGNFVEQFDYGIYGYMAPVMAPVFFPASNPAAGVLSTYAIIAISCLFRPIGGSLVGRWGDRVGRKKALLWTIIFMGVLTALIGMLPTYSQVGLFAPLMLLFIRVLQGIVSGGEYVGAVAFIVEWATPGRRAYYTSFASISCFVGLLGGAGTAALINGIFTAEQVENWGWRLPFLAVLPLSLVGLWLRSRVGETPEFVRATKGGTDIVKAPITEALRSQWKPILVFCGASITLAILSYTWVTYYPEYLTGTLHLPRSTALLSNAISIAVLIPLLPLAGKLSDRIGRRPMLIMGCVSCIVIVPLAFMVAQHGTFTAALVGQLIYLIPEFFMTGIVTVCVAELFATRTRFSAGAIAYNSSFSVFAGITPFIAALLVTTFGTIYAVWGYLAVAAGISLIVITKFMTETYRTDLGSDKYAAAE